MSNLIRSLAARPNPNIPYLRPGDTVRVFNRIVEGEQERVQVFQGVVTKAIASSTGGTFTVRRIAAHGVGVERTFSTASPRLEKVEVVRQSHVRRARLYYLRGRTGKAARLRAKRYVQPEAELVPSAEATEPEIVQETTA